MDREVVVAVFLTSCLAGAVTYLVVEQIRHTRNLRGIETRILVNGIRGKSSITRLIAGALRVDRRRTVIAKTTGTAARFIYPGGREAPIVRKAGIVNVIEQVAVIARARAVGADTAVVECMAVMPDLQELNQRKLIRSTIGVISNVREDHLEEMGGPGRSLDQVARSLCRGMPVGGVCVTAERDRWHVLAEEAAARGTRLIYADPESVTDAELARFSWITFKENVAVALVVAGLCGVPRRAALTGMYGARPDPGVLRVDFCRYNGKRFAAVNLFAANDPQSTVLNLRLLRDRRKVSGTVTVVINCRPDRVERNAQMGSITGELGAGRIVLIGSPTRSALDSVPAALRDRVLSVDGDQHTGEDLLEAISGVIGDDPGHALVMIGNIHGRGEHLLDALRTVAVPHLPLTDAATQVLPVVPPTNLLPPGLIPQPRWDADTSTVVLPLIRRRTPQESAPR